jgi:hypothetical protein
MMVSEGFRASSVLLVSAFLAGPLLCDAVYAESGERILGYITHIPPESPEARAARHKEVARRRQGTPIIVHRGMRDLAPENTLEAYAAAMDIGADGCEIDIRRSKDGVLYLHHDDELGRMLEGSGKLKNMTYYEILTTPLKIKGTATKETRVPTLAAFLVLARQRAMLIHLDTKEPGIQDEMIRMFEEADMWDHLVEVNGGNAEKIRSHPKVKLLPYKGWVPDGKEAANPKYIKSALERQGAMLISVDPRATLRYLKKQGPEKPVPLPKNVRAWWTPEGLASTRPS